MLRRRAFAIFSLLSLIAVPVAAQATGPTHCARLEQALMRLGDPDPAECLEGKALGNVRATLPKGLRLAAVRGLYVDDGGRYVEVDSRRTPVDLDRPDAEGNPFGGALLVAGKRQWRGHLRYEPNNAWHFAFVPEAQIDDASAPLQRAFATIVLDRDDGTLPVSPPASLAAAGCWEATATAHFADFSVLLGDGELAGVRPMMLRLSNVRDFRACPSSDSNP